MPRSAYADGCLRSKQFKITEKSSAPTRRTACAIVTTHTAMPHAHQRSQGRARNPETPFTGHFRFWRFLSASPAFRICAQAPTTEHVSELRRVTCTRGKRPPWVRARVVPLCGRRASRARNTRTAAAEACGRTHRSSLSATEPRAESARRAPARDAEPRASRSGLGRGQLQAPPASIRGKRRPLQNDVLENGLFRPPLRASNAASKMQAHRRTRGLSVHVHRQDAAAAALGAALVRAPSVARFPDDGLEEDGSGHEEAACQAAAAGSPARGLERGRGVLLHAHT